MKNLLFSILTVFFGSILCFQGCKKTKEDKAIELLEKVYSLKDYAEYLNSPNVKEFKSKVEKRSEQYFDKFWALIPEKYHKKNLVPDQENSFLKFEKYVLESPEFSTFYETDSYIEKFDELEDFKEVDDYLKSKIQAVKHALSLITNKFEWKLDEQQSSRVTTKLRAFFRILNLQFLLETRKGKWEKSMKVLDDHIFLLNTLENARGDIITRLLSFTGQKLTYGTIIKVISQKDITNTQLILIKNKLDKLKVPSAEKLNSIMCYSMENYVKLCAALTVSPKDYLWLIFYPITAISEDPEKLKSWFDEQCLKKKPFEPEKFIKDQVIFYEVFGKDLIRKCHPDDMLSKKIVDKLETTKLDNLNNFFQEIYCKSVLLLKGSLNDVQTRNDIVYLILQLRLYEFKNNKLPNKLIELNEDGLNNIPKDLNSREELKYYPNRREIIVSPQPGLSTTINF